MGRIRDWWDWKVRGIIPTFTAIDFYLMLDYYDTKSLNIAVIGNRKKYEWVINNLINQLKKEKNPNNKVLQPSENRCIFLRDGIESTFVLIEDIHNDLEKYGLKYRKYM